MAQQLLQPMREVAAPIIDAVGVLPHAAIGAVHADPVDPCRYTRLMRC